MPSHDTTPAREGVALLLPAPLPETGAPSPTLRRLRSALLLLLALSTGGLLYLCYFPVGAGWLAWFALVPFLALVRSGARPIALYLCAFAGGLAFFWPVLQWMRVADPRMYATWAFLATYCALYFPAALYFLRRLDCGTPLPLTVTLPVTWAALELFRSSFIGLFASLLKGSHLHDYPGGFSWYLLGYTQHDVLEVIQIADLGGVYAVTFLVCVVNALLFEALFVRAWFRAGLLGMAERAGWFGTRRGLLAQGLAGLALFVATLAYGSWRLGQDTQEPGPHIALLQSNLAQSIRNDSGSDDKEKSTAAHDEIQRHCSDLCWLAAKYRRDLIVWPETSYPVSWGEVAPGIPNGFSRGLAREASKAWHTNLLLGMEAAVVGEDGRPRRYNSAVHLGPGGQYLGRYDKVHRVPFGEYVPLRDSLPWMNRLAPYEFDYSVQPGESFTQFALKSQREERPPWHFGVVICYEDTVPEMARPYAGRVDFLVNVSNDGWFDGTAEHDEHLAMCRFRAVELRRSVARSVNMGISAVIDSNGKVLRPELLEPLLPSIPVWEVSGQKGAPGLPVSEWADYKKVRGVLLATVPIDSRSSLYARWGNWLPWSCWALLALGLLATAFRRCAACPTGSA